MLFGIWILMKSLFLVLALLAVPALSRAEERNWIKVSSYPAGATYIDADSGERAGNFVTAWSRTEWVTPVKVSATQSMSSGLTLSEFDCADITVARLQTIAYAESNLQGKVIWTETKDSKKAKKDDAPPGSIGEEIVNAVCLMF